MEKPLGRFLFLFFVCVCVFYLLEARAMWFYWRRPFHSLHFWNSYVNRCVCVYKVLILHQQWLFRLPLSFVRMQERRNRRRFQQKLNTKEPWNSRSAISYLSPRQKITRSFFFFFSVFFLKYKIRYVHTILNFQRSAIQFTLGRLPRPVIAVIYR